MKPRPPQQTIPERFKVGRSTLIIDKFMTGLIAVGGIAIIVAVFFIFVFIAFKIAPLFSSADVELAFSFDAPVDNIASIGIDEWLELPYFVTKDGRIYFLELEDDERKHENRGLFQEPFDIPEGFDVYRVAHDPSSDRLVITSTDGRFLAVDIDYEATFPGGARNRKVVPKLDVSPVFELGATGVPIEEIRYGRAPNRRLVAGIQVVNGQPQLHALTLTQRRTPFGVGPLQIGDKIDLTPHLRGRPQHLLVPTTADAVMVAYDTGEVDFFRLMPDGTLDLAQSFTPFPESVGARGINRMEYILGDETIIFFDDFGGSVAWNRAFIAEENARMFVHSKTFQQMQFPPNSYSASRRNKTFLVTTPEEAILSLMTTEGIRWREHLDFTNRIGIITPRHNALLFLDDHDNLHLKRMVDDHPIAGMKTFFAKIQYEGRPGRIWDWQSDGDAFFERKLSMMPLIIGTLKGTVYAMLIAVPVALFGALYVSQFLRPSFKKIVKPTMEIMASLPSVILGFFAGMWLAPIVSNSIPSVVLAVAGLIGGTVLMGIAWSHMPNRVRLSVPSGMEFIIVCIPAFSFAYLGWELGIPIENWIFLQHDETLGREIGSFRMWVVGALGWDFETRNALVVGFAMGFAVIPIIFTIAEDSLSNVPNAFRSGSLALGASRWQTAIRIVLPTAAAGIFSALMIGFGRAIGETMIMVMATGNSVVQDFNPFTGMRTLSANIAVEISEAEQNGTLYRTLFFCAFLLFIFTFTLNTIAEILRQWLRKRYRAVE